MNPTRRHLLASAGALLPAALAPALLPSAAQAAAPMLGASRPGFRRVTLGGFEVTTLLDGAVPAENPHGVFGQDQELASVEALLRENRLPETSMEFTFFPVLVNTGDALILFDTGNGAAARPARGRLTDRIAEAGYSADQIDTVVITHMHPDHIAGLMEEGAPTFPNASYVTGAEEYNFWTNDARVGTPGERIYSMAQEMVVPLAEKFRFVAPGDAVVSGIEAMNAFGHTPGHMTYHLESEGQRLLLAADTANHFVLSLQRPDWEVRFDMDKAAAAATRKKVFGMLAADGVAFSGYHMPFPALGYVEAMGEGFRYVPAAYQFDA